MGSATISYAGVAGAVSGVVGLLGVYSDWWETADTVYDKSEFDRRGNVLEYDPLPNRTVCRNCDGPDDPNPAC